MEQIVGLSAIVNGIAFITSALALVIFFSIGGIWGRINDGLSVIWALTFIPIALFLYQLHQPLSPAPSLLSALIGIAAMVAFAMLQTLLILGTLKFQQTTSPVLASSAVIGSWILVNCALAIWGQTLPSGLILFGLIFGISVILGSLSFWLAGEHSMLCRPLPFWWLRSPGRSGPSGWESYYSPANW